MGYEIPADHHTSAPDSIRESRKATRGLREYEPFQMNALASALSYLKDAREEAIFADCPSLLKKIRSAIKSAEGAKRHMERRREARYAKALLGSRSAVDVRGK